MTYELYLAHHGILGMKWGVRRYQNADGSLTAAGRKRYEKGVRKATKEYERVQNRERSAAEKETYKRAPKFKGGTLQEFSEYQKKMQALYDKISATNMDRALKNDERLKKAEAEVRKWGQNSVKDLPWTETDYLERLKEMSSASDPFPEETDRKKKR